MKTIIMLIASLSSVACSGNELLLEQTVRASCPIGSKMLCSRWEERCECVSEQQFDQFRDDLENERYDW